MMRFAKQWVLRSLDQAGYRLLKKADHDALQAAAAAAHGAPAAVPPPPPPPVASIGPSALDLTEAAGADAALAGFLHDAPHGLAPPRAFALYRVVQYLARAGIAGEIVDCGHGATTTLAAIAAASMSCGETNRRLVLFDASADPLHRAETELELWGTARDLIADVPDARPHKPEPPPAELAATGYPSDRIVVRRYPREPIAQSEPVAFLGLTSETYPANQQAIATFLPKVSPRGVIAVEGNRSADAVAQFLARSGVNLLFMQVTADYRVAVRP